MKMFLKLMLFTWLLSGSVVAEESSLYRLSTGDQLSITVFNEPELNVNAGTISDNGRIAIPLLGQVEVKGKTIAEVEQLLVAMFKDGYLKKPSLSISISTFRPFYINGEVARPGSYPFRTKMNVQMAVTIAGGFTERASRSSIYVVKEQQLGAEKKKVGLEYEISPGDILTVEESFF